MFFRNSNLRRATGLLGVALALLSGIQQQSHALCFLAGCHGISVSIEETGPKTDRLRGACSCSRNSRRTLSATDASVTTERQGAAECEAAECGGVGQHHGACPCPPTCWCHVSSAPLGLPVSESRSAERLPPSMEPSPLPMTALVQSDLGPKRSLETTIARSKDGARLRCAKLCRFRI